MEEQREQGRGSAKADRGHEEGGINPKQSKKMGERNYTLKKERQRWGAGAR